METRTVDTKQPSGTPPGSAGGRWFGGARALSNGIPQIFLLAWGLMVLLPLLWLLVSSFKTNMEIYNHPFGPPSEFRLFTYSNAWEKADIGTYFLNSVIVVTFGVLLTLLLAAMTAYILARYPFPGSRYIYYLYLVGMTFPLFLAIVPLYKITQAFGLFQNLHGLVVVYVAFSLPFSVFFLTAFFDTLPKELAESAFIDGAGHFRTFFQIMLPMARPGLLSIGVFNFLGQWNQYLLPVVLNPPDSTVDGRNQLLTQGLAELALGERYESSPTSIAEMCAGLVIAMIPVLAVYIVFQRRVEEGLTAGALK